MFEKQWSIRLGLNLLRTFLLIVYIYCGCIDHGHCFIKPDQFDPWTQDQLGQKSICQQFSPTVMKFCCQGAKLYAGQWISLDL